MKISIINPTPNFSGGIRVVSIYALKLKKMGHEVTLYSLPRPKRSPKEILKDLVRLKWRPYTKRVSSHFDSIDVRHIIINEHRPMLASDLDDADIIIATWWETAEWIENLPLSKGIKFYFLQHYEIFDYLPIERVKRTWTLPYQKIVISKWLLKIASQEFGDETAMLIPNSVDQTQFHAPPRTRNAVPTVGFLYGKQAWKGVAVSVEAYGIAKKVFPNLRLVAFGTESPSPDSPLPTDSEFYLLPAQEKIKDIYAKCDFWLCGSWSEGFCLPLTEAMACRCPVVSTMVGGPIDLIKNGWNGYLSPCGDARGLADNLIKGLSLSPEDWLMMSNNALDTVSQYTWDDAAKLFDYAMNSAIEGHRLPQIVSV